METSIKNIIENAIQGALNIFVKTPFRFFNEADAVTYIVRNLAANIDEKSLDTEKHGVVRVHQGYPASCFGTDGYFDIVVLNPEFIQQNIEITSNLARPDEDDRQVNLCGKKTFDAIIEVKFLYEAPGRHEAITHDFDKLNKTQENADGVYFIYFQRLLKKGENWPNQLQFIEQHYESKTFENIQTYIAVGISENPEYLKIVNSCKQRDLSNLHVVFSNV